MAGFNPFDEAIFAAGAPCLPCCRLPSVCAMLVGSDSGSPSPGNGTIFFNSDPFTPFSSYAEAVRNVQTFDVALSNSIVAGCAALCGRAGSSPSANFSATSSSFTLTVVSDVVQTFVCFSAKAGDVITVSSGLTVPWFCLDNSTMAGIAGGPGADTFTIPADGTYLISLIYPSPSARTVSSTGAMVINPVIALWDDSGTTRQLEACPKMLIPPLTESTGDWYENCAAAADAMDPETGYVGTNCITYNLSPNYASFSATGGSSLALTCATSTVTPGFKQYASINLVAGQSLSMAFTATADTGSFQTGVEVYDDTGTLLDSNLSAVNAASGTLNAFPATGSVAPYTGRYIVAWFVNAVLGSISSGSATFTSSGTMSVNSIQALYDTGLDCPSRLNCGDSCP